jgi:GR25 family glycosyltransferase involved in LPS biosynthesis
MDINDFTVYCINLDERKDRWHESLREFSHFPINKVNRFPAIKHDNPVIGCALSHFQAMERCLETGKHFMVFEDDVHFINNYKEFPAYLERLDMMWWDMFYLGANITQPITKISDKFGKLRHAQSTHAYCINKNFITTVLEYKGLLGKPMDLIYAENIIPLSNAFITIPMLAIQRPSYSNIENQVVNYSWMEKRYFENLRKD